MSSTGAEPPYNHLLLLTTVVALRNHLYALPTAKRTTAQIHSVLYEWPAPEGPIGLTVAALRELEKEGTVEYLSEGAKDYWIG